MEVTNQTPLAARINEVSSSDGRRFGCLVAKATFALREGESRLDTQTPYGLFREDVETELGILPNDQTPRHESAFDVMLLAAAYGDGNGPVPSRRVALEVGGRRRELVVFGDRRWEGDRASEPVPFARMPLTWERAFGGSTLVEIDREAFLPVDYPLNPFGRGFDATEGARIIADALKAPSGYPKFTRDDRLPNVEDPNELVTSRKSTPLPACWAPAPPRVLAPIAPVLAELTENPAGVQTSAAWQRFQRRCHPTWILSEPPAGRLRLEGCLPGGEVIDAGLPSVEVWLDYDVAGRSGSLRCSPCTLVVLADERRAYLVYRAWFVSEPGGTSDFRLRLKGGGYAS